MRRRIAIAIAATLALLALALPAQAIVHGSAPICPAGAVAASGGKAGGAAAAPVLTDPSNPAPGPPMPAQGGERSGKGDCTP